MNDIPLPRLSARLAEVTGSPPPGGYVKLHKMATSGAFPVRWANGRIYVREADLPVIAAACGLRIQEQVAA